MQVVVLNIGMLITFAVQVRVGSYFQSPTHPSSMFVNPACTAWSALFKCGVLFRIGACKYMYFAGRDNKQR